MSADVLQQISTGLEEFSNTNVKEIEASATDLTETIRSVQDHALERKRKLEAVRIYLALTYYLVQANCRIAKWHLRIISISKNLDSEYITEDAC